MQETETIKAHLGRRLRARQETQMQIAAATGLGQTTVGRIMRGECNPTLDVAQALFDWLGPERRPGRKRRGS